MNNSSEVQNLPAKRPDDDSLSKNQKQKLFVPPYKVKCKNKIILRALMFSLWFIWGGVHHRFSSLESLSSQLGTLACFPTRKHVALCTFSPNRVIVPKERADWLTVYDRQVGQKWSLFLKSSHNPQSKCLLHPGRNQGPNSWSGKAPQNILSLPCRLDTVRSQAMAACSPHELSERSQAVRGYWLSEHRQVICKLPQGSWDCVLLVDPFTLSSNSARLLQQLSQDSCFCPQCAHNQKGQI